MPSVAQSDAYESDPDSGDIGETSGSSMMKMKVGNGDSSRKFIEGKGLSVAASAEIQRVFGQKAIDNTATLALLLSQKVEPDSYVERERYLYTLISAVPLLKFPLHEPLVHTVLGATDWTIGPPCYIDVYTRFLENLVVTHTAFMTPVSEMLISLLIPPESNYVPEYNLVFEKIHSVLFHLLHLVPQANQHLSLIISKLFPDLSDPVDQLGGFLDNILKMAEYSAIIRGQIILVIFEKLVKMDLYTQYRSQADSDTESENEDMIDDDIDDDEISNDIVMDEEAALSLSDLKSKVDIMISKLIQWATLSSHHQAVADNIFENILSAFQKVLLPTHRSKSLQFVVFVVVQQNEQYMEAFLHNVLSILHDPTTPIPILQATSAYLGSFVEHARMVQSNHVQSIFNIICQSIDSFLDAQNIYGYNYSGTSSVNDSLTQAQFDSCTHTLMYLYTTRTDSLQRSGMTLSISPAIIGSYEEEQLNSRSKINSLVDLEILSRAIYSAFNPLLSAPPKLAHEFAKAARESGLLYCDSIIEHNNVMTSSAISLKSIGAGQGKSDNGTNGIRNRSHAAHDFRPFDKLDLSVAYDLIIPHYRF